MDYHNLAVGVLILTNLSKNMMIYFHLPIKIL